MRPLACIEKEAFKNLVLGFACNDDIRLPCRRTVAKRLDARKKIITEKLIQTFDKVDYICTTADIWSCHNRSFLGMTAHFIERNTFERKNVILGCRRFKYSHTYDRIAEAISTMHNEFSLCPSKITFTVTDNASNFGKAFREFHKPDLNNSNSTQALTIVLDSEDDTDYEEEIIIVHENILTQNIELEYETEAEANEHMLPRHTTCISHSLSLLVTSDGNKALDVNPRYKNNYQSAFSKAQSLWNVVSRSTKASDISSDICGSKFVVPVLTRWNSTYDAVKKIIKEKSKINEVLEKLNLQKFKIADIIFLEEYLKVLEPIAVALDNLQGENNCYLGMVLPSLYTIKLKLNAISHLSYCEPLKTALQEGLQRRFAAIMDVHSSEAKHFLLATISHPRFKLTWLTLEKEYDVCKALFLDEYKYINSKINTDAESDTSDSSDFFSCLSPKSASNSQALSENVANAVLYLENKKRTVDLLNSYPIVKEIFLKYNTTLPSSAPVERMFSSGSQILVPRRCNLSDKMFDTLMFLKGNSSL